MSLVDEQNRDQKSAWRVWLKRVGIVLGLLLVVLILFHRPILQTVVRRAAISIAEKQNLKLDLRVEGSVIGGIVLRNVRASATGPSAVQSADIDLLRADYSLLGYLRGGMADLLESVELRNANIVLDPAAAPPAKEVVEDQQMTVPAFFPGRLTLSNVNVRVKSQPEDIILEGLSLDLNPEKPGELRIAKLQLSNGRAWDSVTAQTTYENRNLFLKNLQLDEETKFEVVNIDASKIDQNKLDVAIKGEVAGGKLDTTLSLGEKDKSVETKIDLTVEDTSIDAVRSYLEPPKVTRNEIEIPKPEPTPTPASGGAEDSSSGTAAKAAKAETGGSLIPEGIDGRVKRLSIKGEGKPDQPSSWNGKLEAEMEDLSAQGLTFDSMTIDASAQDGQAKIETLRLTRGENTISVEGTAQLPEEMSQFGRVPANLQLRANVPELSSLTSGMAEPVKGPAEVNGQIKVEDGTLVADLVAVAGPLGFSQGSLQKAVVRLNAARKMPPPSEEEKAAEAPLYENLRSQLSAEVTGLRYSDYVLDSINANVRSEGKEVVVERVEAVRGENRLQAQARYELPQDFSKAMEQPGTVTVKLAAPKMEAFFVEGASTAVSGSLELYAQTELGPQLGGGSFNLYGTNLATKGFTIPEISAQGTVAGDVVYLNDFTAQLSEDGYIRTYGQVAVEQPYAFGGQLDLHLADLKKFERFLGEGEKQTKLRGELKMNWQGRGSMENPLEAGRLDFNLQDGVYGELDNLQAKVEANYSPQELNVPIVYAASDKLMFQAIMQAKGEKLEVTKIQIIQGEEKYADGYLEIPFVWENVGTEKPLFPAEGKVLVNFQTKNLEIDKLAKNLGTEVPVSGLVDLKINSQGTVDDLKGSVDLQVTGLRSGQLKEFQPAKFQLQARLENDQVKVEGTLEQARIQPVKLTATLPLDVAKILSEKKIDDSTPVQASVRMERSSINFVRQFVPAVQRIDGSLALNVDVGGTIANPTFGGAAEMSINATRFSNATLPSISNFNARLVFRDDRLSFEQFRGELAGGPFTLSGQITFPKLTEPNFDLRLKADAVLVARSSDLNVRTDADITVRGPFDSATVAGTVGITNSKLLKNIDLIPIGVPGRPPPAPQPPAEGPAELSFPNPPLRDWKFDLSIKTKDPFYVRGNVAKGAALVDMRVTGTGLEPLVDGSVRLQNLDVTLPFSRLEITRGLLYFNPQEPFNPNLDIQGTSLIQDYTVRVNVYGTADRPEAIFSSQPPLPQEDIITLLSTGVTREQLASGGNVLAGRALILLGKQLYQKLFKKETTADPNSFFDRLDVEVGGVDTRTGQQTATARYRATDQIRLIGEIGVQGDFRGTVKYLIRFR